MKGKILFCWRIVAAVLIVLLLLQTFNFNFSLKIDAASEEKSSAFTFTVLDKNNSSPISGAEVSVNVTVVNSVYNIDEDSFTLEGITDEDGICSFIEITELMSDDIELWCEYEVAKNGYYDRSDQFKISNSNIGFTGNVDVKLKPIPTVIVRGRIHDDKGIGISDAMVWLKGDKGYEYSVNTDKNGEFIIPDVYDIGKYLIEVTHQHYNTSFKKDVNLKEYHSIKMDSKYFKTRVGVRVHDENNKGISGVEISLIGEFNYSGVTGRDGYFLFPEVFIVGKYSIVIKHDDYVTTYIEDANIEEKEYNDIEISITEKSEQEEPLIFEIPSPTPITYGTKFKNAASGGEGTGGITYSVDNEDIAIVVDEEGKLDIKKAGVITVTATKAGDDNYKPQTAQYRLEIKKAEQTDFAFVKDNVLTEFGIFEPNNLTPHSQSKGVVRYTIESDPNNLLQGIDEETGEYTFNNNYWFQNLDEKKPGQHLGNVIIRATKKGDERYKDAIAEYTLSVNNSSIDPKDTYNIESEEGNNGWYKYFKISAKRGYSFALLDNLNEWVENIMLSSVNGGFFFLGKAPNENVYPIKFQELKVDSEKPEINAIEYSKPNNILDIIKNVITLGFYKEEMTATIKVSDKTSGIKSLSYSFYEELKKDSADAGAEKRVVKEETITFEEPKKEVTYNLKIEPQFKGKLFVTVIDEAGNVLNYNSYDDKSGDKPNVIVVDNLAPEVTVEYDNNDVHNGKYYNSDRTAIVKIKEANFYAEDVEFTIEKWKKGAEKPIIEKVEPSFEEVTIDGTVYHIAKIPFNEDADYTFDVKYTDKSGNTFDSYEKDEFTIDKTKPKIKVYYNENNKNNKYYKKERTATIEIEEYNFNPEGLDATITIKNACDEIIDSEEYITFLRDPLNWVSKDGVNVAKITFKKDGHYSLDINYTDLAGNVAEKNFEDNFVIDKTAPTNLSITYSEPVLDIILDAISFGFYNKSMFVEISADDLTSGVDYFKYSYNVDNGASPINEGGSGIIPAEGIKYENGIKTAKATFKIDPQFRGKISFEAVDKAGNMSKFDGDKVIVVDNIAPNVKVYFDNNNVVNESFYNAYRSATIEIEEANFFEDDVVITVGKRGYGDSDYTETRVRPQFVKSEDNDVYTAQIEFNEDGDYTFDISYTDKSGNVFDSYEINEFSIDTTKPVIKIDFDNNSALNGNFYNEQRIATITVEEHYFKPENLVVTYSAVDIENNKVATEDFVAYLKNPENWTTNGDIHTAKIAFSEDARYTFNLSYTDFAGNKSDEHEDYEFIIDKTKPENLAISYSTPLLDTIIDNLKFGFYNSPVEVTITADDRSAGIDYVIYSYEVEAGSSPKNKGLTEQKVTSDNISYSNNGRTATVRFSIPPQYRGRVNFQVVDKAGNISIFEDEKIVVVDNIAPGVTVRYDNNSPKNTKYYNTNRTATITIDEANFFSEDVKIIVGKRLDYDTNYRETAVNPKFTKNGDIYTADVVFDEDADYTFDISYTDKSGNVFDSYTKDEFTIDKKNPQIQVTYDNNSAINYNKFKERRVATIKITEHNFRASDIDVRIIGRDKNGNTVVNLGDRLKSESAWTHNGDVHTATVVFDEDANYEFNISCEDLAGNKNSPVDYSSSVAPTEFTVDKTLPTGLIEIGEWHASKDGTVWDIFLEVITMGLWTNKELMVNISAEDALSGVDYIKYFKTATPVSLKEIMEKSEGWTVFQGDKTSFRVQPDEQFIVYASIVDKAGNVTYISSDGVIVDNTKPAVRELSPKISLEVKESSKNNIFNKDVTVDIRVEDPIVNGSVYSGLKSIEYKVVNMGSVTQEGVLYTFDKVNPSKADLLQQWKGNIVVDSKKNNSNDIKVIVTAVDNAGNTATETLPLMIDITPPKIKVSYDNNSDDNIFNGYFKEERTATVVITERNFRKEDVNLKITNTHGVQPRISDWSYVGGKGNGDEDTYTAKIIFAEDGDYTFDISYVDLANNSNVNVDFGDSVAPTKFTIDKTLPVVEVRYSNDRPMNENYFNAYRTATIYITEHNFDVSRVKISMTSTDDGKPNAIPVVSHWTSNGDIHSATVNFSKDSLYTFDIEVTDKAGNMAADYKEDSFYIDTTEPTILITGVADKSANNGDVMPVVECYDTNIDFQNVTISLVGANRNSVKLDGITERTHNGMIFRFNNFEKVKEVDDLYTLSVNAVDKAGNASNKSITFSVNRFGSVYSVSESTKKILNKFISKEEDITFIETNVDALQEVRITLFKDNITKVLVRGKDYTVEEISGENMWHQYIYKIKKENFVEDGVYRIIVYSVDEANNKSGNNMDSKLTEISFAVDKTPPNIIVADLESNKTYPLANKPVSMSVNDNLSLESVDVLLNGEELKSWTKEEIKNGGLQDSGFNFEISGDSTKAHTISIVATDSAGNKQTVDIKNFYVTTNLIIRFRNNKFAFYGTTGGMTTLAMFAVYVILRRRKLKIAN